ncbi:MAG: hypothetical protein CMK59_04170 [Proteobacteria bacterium]|nr:hypothetical protein [Pseudomonadota bacterium]
MNLFQAQHRPDTGMKHPMFSNQIHCLRGEKMLFFLSACIEQFSVSLEADFDGDGWTELEGDCDDRNARVSPSSPEICDYLDNNCDGLVDQDLQQAVSFFRDEDGDGYGDEEGLFFSCLPPQGWETVSGDCDDAHPQIHPKAEVLWSTATVDHNCDGQRDSFLRSARPTWDIQVNGLVHLQRGWSNHMGRPLLVGHQTSEVLEFPYPGVVSSFVNVAPYTVEQLLPTENGRLLTHLLDPQGEEQILFFEEHLDQNSWFGASGGIELHGAELISWANLGPYSDSGNVLAFSIWEAHAAHPILVLIEEESIMGVFWDLESLLAAGDVLEPEHFSGMVWGLGDLNADGFSEMAIGKKNAVVFEVYYGAPYSDSYAPRWSLRAEVGCDLWLGSSRFGNDLLCSSLYNDEKLLFEDVGIGNKVDLHAAQPLPVLPEEIMRASEGVFAWLSEHGEVRFSPFDADVSVGYSMQNLRGLQVEDWFGQGSNELLVFGHTGIYLLELPL